MGARQSLWSAALLVLTTYAAWLISSMLGVGALITWHSTVPRLYVRFGFDNYTIAFFNNMVVIARSVDDSHG